MSLLHPESDLSMSVVAQGASVLSQLAKRKGPVLIDELFASFAREDHRRNLPSFMAALEFLFAVGAISHSDYRIFLERDTSPPRNGDLFESSV